MSGIGSVSGVAQMATLNAATLQKQGAAGASSNVRDSDGDFDGTRPGQVDAKDRGIGLNVDRMA